MGVPVRPFSPWVDRLEDARLIHLFGMSREGLELARVARSRRVPVVISPICWFEPRALAALAPSPMPGVLDLAKWAARRAVPRLPGWRRELLQLSDAILPNSRAEARQLVRLFGTNRARIHVVLNGVDPRFAEADPTDAFRERLAPRRVRPLRRPDRAAKECPRLDSRREAGRLAARRDRRRRARA